MKKLFTIVFLTLLCVSCTKAQTSKFTGNWISKEKGNEGFCKLKIIEAKDSATLEMTDFSCHDELITVYDMVNPKIMDKQIICTLKHYGEEGGFTEVKCEINLLSDDEIEIKYENNYFKTARYVRDNK